MRLGEPKDFLLLDSLLKETATRLQNKGSSQWNHILKGEETRELHKRLSQNEIFVFEEENVISGMCYLYQVPNSWDNSLWNQKEEKGSYYLHKVVVSDLFVGQKYGEKLLAKVFEWVKENQGEKIKLDCKSDVAYLNQLYQQIGFQFVRMCSAEISENVFADFNLYEYPVQ